MLYVCNVDESSIVSGNKFSTLVNERAKKENVLKIKAQFIQTKKNMPAKNFLADFGFKKDGDNWYVDTNQQIKKSKHLHIE